jgi:hypothetical protein
MGSQRRGDKRRWLPASAMFAGVVGQASCCCVQPMLDVLRVSGVRGSQVNVDAAGKGENPFSWITHYLER